LLCGIILKRTVYLYEINHIKQHNYNYKLSIYQPNIYRASIIVSSGIKRFDFSRVVSDKNRHTITAMLDKKSLMFFEEISPPLQQETEDATQMASNKQ